jgi:hypothetical protein
VPKLPISEELRIVPVATAQVSNCYIVTSKRSLCYQEWPLCRWTGMEPTENVNQSTVNLENFQRNGETLSIARLTATDR